ncbi:hypothetical protein SEA_HITTER_64 [Gordonia phage Hitter]|nr:hypothetical protein SEA_HITTER_64 [Gordonia phage Hitter]
MGGTLTNVTTFEIETCCSCSVQFAMPTELRNRRLRDHEAFWCPNGHRQWYVGKTEEQKLRERLEREERRAANAEENVRIERASHAATKGRLTATKGQLTKTKKRIANGVCPCCHRSFVNVARHMNSQHPDYSETKG